MEDVPHAVPIIHIIQIIIIVVYVIHGLSVTQFSHLIQMLGIELHQLNGEVYPLRWYAGFAQGLQETKYNTGFYGKNQKNN